MSVTSHGPPVLYNYIVVCVCVCACGRREGSEEFASPLVKEKLTQGVFAGGPACLGHSISEQHLTLQIRHQQSGGLEKLTR